MLRASPLRLGPHPSPHCFPCTVPIVASAPLQASATQREPPTSAGCSGRPPRAYLRARLQDVGLKLLAAPVGPPLLLGANITLSLYVGPGCQLGIVLRDVHNGTWGEAASNCRRERCKAFGTLPLGEVPNLAWCTSSQEVCMGRWVGSRGRQRPVHCRGLAGGELLQRWCNCRHQLLVQGPLQQAAPAALLTRGIAFLGHLTQAILLKRFSAEGWQVRGLR